MSDVGEEKNLYRMMTLLSTEQPKRALSVCDYPINPILRAVRGIGSDLKLFHVSFQRGRGGKRPSASLFHAKHTTHRIWGGAG